MWRRVFRSPACFFGTSFLASLGIRHRPNLPSTFSSATLVHCYPLATAPLNASCRLGSVYSLFLVCKPLPLPAAPVLERSDAPLETKFIHRTKLSTAKHSISLNRFLDSGPEMLNNSSRLNWPIASKRVLGCEETGTVDASKRVLYCEETGTASRRGKSVTKVANRTVSRPDSDSFGPLAGLFGC